MHALRLSSLARVCHRLPAATPPRRAPTSRHRYALNAMAAAARPTELAYFADTYLTTTDGCTVLAVVGLPHMR